MNPLKEEYEFLAEKISKFTCIFRMAGNDEGNGRISIPKGSARGV